MIRYFFRLLKGYVRIQIKSISPEYFLERCRINGIFFWELVCLKKGEYQCSLFLKDFYRLRGCARGKGVRLRICERRGLPFFLQRNRKRWYAAAGLSSFFLLLYIMSLFIWDIHFQGNHHYTADTLVRYLDTQDVRYGMKKKKINCEELEAGMREAFPQITWVSARVSGTRLVIQIKENKIIGIQRYKGLGEMDAEQLWETTLDPESRILAQVTISDTVEADDITTTLMSSNVLICAPSTSASVKMMILS